MSITCEVICDLLPLYHDGVCSNSSKLLVEEHLHDCEICRKELSMMDIELKTSYINSEREKSFRAVASAWKKAKRKSFTKGIAVIVTMLFVIASLFSFSFSFKTMEGLSMSGHIEDGDICFISRLAYSVTDPTAGDVVFARVKIDGRFYDDIVRIIALPGDTISIENGTLYINNVASSYYGDNAVLPFDINKVITLNENEYFAMGDNQSSSIDSRSISYGMLSKDEIRGKVLYVFSPISNPFTMTAYSNAAN